MEALATAFQTVLADAQDLQSKTFALGEVVLDKPLNCMVKQSGLSPALVILIWAALLAVWCPLQWNLIARNEYRNKTLTRLFGMVGGAYTACYALAVFIFTTSLFRSFVIVKAMATDPDKGTLHTNPDTDNFYNSFLPLNCVPYTGMVLVAVGSTLVISSFLRLGVTGTYLGDYFGILMNERVTGFPFSVTTAPMYYGSTFEFLGYSLIYGSPRGLLLTFVVLIVYQVAIAYEDAFTAMIYARRGSAHEFVANLDAVSPAVAELLESLPRGSFRATRRQVTPYEAPAVLPERKSAKSPSKRPTLKKVSSATKSPKKSAATKGKKTPSKRR